jgi:hypothetical protein
MLPPSVNAVDVRSKDTVLLPDGCGDCVIAAGAPAETVEADPVSERASVPRVQAPSVNPSKQMRICLDIDLR